MKKSKKKNKKKNQIVKGYLIFTGVVAAVTLFAGAFFTAGETSKFVTLGDKSITVKSLISGYTQAQGIFTEPMESGEKKSFPKKLLKGYRFFFPLPLTECMIYPFRFMNSEKT